MSRRILQIVLAIIGLITIITGALHLIPRKMTDLYELTPKNISEAIYFDSNFRYFSGVWTGLGIILFCIVPSIERQKVILRSLSLMIFIGAIGRIISIFSAGIPPVPFIIFTLLELFFPVLILWQNKIAKSAQ